MAKNLPTGIRPIRMPYEGKPYRVVRDDQLGREWVDPEWKAQLDRDIEAIHACLSRGIAKSYRVLGSSAP